MHTFIYTHMRIPVTPLPSQCLMPSLTATCCCCCRLFPRILPEDVQSGLGLLLEVMVLAGACTAVGAAAPAPQPNVAHEQLPRAAAEAGAAQTKPPPQQQQQQQQQGQGQGQSAPDGLHALAALMPHAQPGVAALAARAAWAHARHAGTAAASDAAAPAAACRSRNSPAHASPLAQDPSPPPGRDVPPPAPLPSITTALFMALLQPIKPSGPLRHPPPFPPRQPPLPPATSPSTTPPSTAPAAGVGPSSLPGQLLPAFRRARASHASTLHASAPPITPSAINLELADWLLYELGEEEVRDAPAPAAPSAEGEEPGGGERPWGRSLSALLPPLLAACHHPGSTCQSMPTSAQLSPAVTSFCVCRLAKQHLLQRAQPLAQRVLRALERSFCVRGSFHGVHADAAATAAQAQPEARGPNATPGSARGKRPLAAALPEPQEGGAGRLQGHSSGGGPAQALADMRRTWAAAAPLLGLLPVRVLADVADRMLKAALAACAEPAARSGALLAWDGTEIRVCEQGSSRLEVQGGSAGREGCGDAGLGPPAKKHKKRREAAAEARGAEAEGGGELAARAHARQPQLQLLCDVALDVALAALARGATLWTPGAAAAHAEASSSGYRSGGSGIDKLGSMLAGISSGAQELVLTQGKGLMPTAGARAPATSWVRWLAQRDAVLEGCMGLMRAPLPYTGEAHATCLPLVRGGGVCGLDTWRA